MNRSRAASVLLLSSLTTAGASPAGIDGLRLWLDASDGSTISTTWGLITQWADKSGAGNHAVQTDVNRQPVLGVGVLAGQNAIRLDALGVGNFTSSPTDDGMLINPGGGFSLDRNYTAYLVDQYWGSNAQGRTLTGNVNNWLLGHWNGAESHYTGEFIGPNVGAGINNPLFSEAVGTGASNYLNRDFRSRGYANAFLNNPGAISIGEDPASVWTEASQADIGELIAFNRALTDTERWQVQDYLRTKYNHPFTISHAHATRSTVFTGGDAGEGLDFAGNFVAAVNVGGPGGFNIGNAAFTSDTGVAAENHIPNWYPAAFGGGAPSANDTSLNTVMNSIRWSAVGNGGLDDVTVTIPGLTPGNTYKVQMLFAEAGVNSSRHHAVELEGKTIHNDYSEGAFRGVDNPNALGNALIHEFVAQDTTLNFRLHSTGLVNGDLNQLLNGFTVEDRGVTGVTTTGTFTSASQLDFSGNFSYAVTMGGAGGQVVGSAAFTSEFTAGVQVGAENNIANWVAGANFGATSDDVNLSGAMSSIRWNETNGHQDGLSLDLDVVTGDVYKLQLLFMEGCCDRGFDVAFEGVRTLDNFNPNAMGANITNSRGAVITHEFTAGDPVFSVMLDGFATGFADRNPILNAFTLERIPEPGTAGLTLFAGALLLRRRRPRGI
jgi:hypothetical protein